MDQVSLYVNTDWKTRQIESSVHTIISVDYDEPCTDYSFQAPFLMPKPDNFRCAMYAVHAAITHALNTLSDKWDILVVITPSRFLEEVIGTDPEATKGLYRKWYSSNKWPQSMACNKKMLGRINEMLLDPDREIHLLYISKEVNEDDPTDMGKTYRAYNRNMFSKKASLKEVGSLQEQLTAMTIANVDLEQCRRMPSKQGHKKAKPSKSLHKKKKGKGKGKEAAETEKRMPQSLEEMKALISKVDRDDLPQLSEEDKTRVRDLVARMKEEMANRYPNGE